MVAIEFTELDVRTSARAVWRLERVCLVRQAVPPGTLALHPGLNVVVVTDDERVGPTVQQLRTVLHDGAAGEHVEFSTPDGRSQVLFRPVGGRARLIDIDTRDERPLQALGGLARPLDEPATALERALVTRLCRVEQAALWTAADRLHAVRAELAQRHGSSTNAGATPIGSPRGGQTQTIDLRTPPKRGFLRRRKPAAGPVEQDGHAALVEAEAAWRAASGDSEVQVLLDDAQAQRHRIVVAAHVLDRPAAPAAGSADGAGAAAGTRHRVDAVVDAVCALVPVRRAAAGPSIVAVPRTIDGELASLVLDELAGIGAERQLVMVTAGGPVEEWAQRVSHAGRVAVLHLDPNGGRADEPTS